MSFRLLISARDPAAALHLVEIARAARSRADVVTHIVAQSPASRYFAQAGLPAEHIDLAPAKSLESAEAAALIESARGILARLRPDAVLCGLSTPFDGGIDEAIQLAYSGPRYVMQDFWGEANLIFGRQADLYLALDEEAVRLSAERHGASATVVGSPRHSVYGSMDALQLRRLERGRLDIPEGPNVFGFFGQSLHHLAGYRRTLDAWIGAVAAQPAPCIALYRPHPRESAIDRDRTVAAFEASGIRFAVSDDVPVESSLVACDVVCSAFSNVSYDVAYLNHFSPAPLITPVSLFFDEEVVAYFRNIVRLKEFPYLKSGLVKPIYRADRLSADLAAAASPEQKSRYWECARGLANPAQAPDRVVDLVTSGVARTSQAEQASQK